MGLILAPSPALRSLYLNVRGLAQLEKVSESQSLYQAGEGLRDFGHYICIFLSLKISFMSIHYFQDRGYTKCPSCQASKEQITDISDVLKM